MHCSAVRYVETPWKRSSVGLNLRCPDSRTGPEPGHGPVTSPAPMDASYVTVKGTTKTWLISLR
jgi:hypothetical protein